MPELPEVETIRRGLSPLVVGHPLNDLIVRTTRLRWEIPTAALKHCCHSPLENLSRRAKYLIFTFKKGSILVHLGMSGRLKSVSAHTEVIKHDHADFIFDTTILRFHDPRRFGCILFTENPAHHPLLNTLGPEPLSDDFDAAFLFSRIKNSNRPIKLALMDQKIVVGVGNIYANEALFSAKILPHRIAKTLSLSECDTLCIEVKKILQHAIHLGGTTLKDFQSGLGEPGFFQQQLLVYGQAGRKCVHCNHIIQLSRLGNRQTAFCPSCQV